MSHPSSPVPCILPSNQVTLASSHVSKAIPTITSNLFNPNVMKVATQTLAAAIVTIALVYIVDEQGTLYSAKLKEFAEVSKDIKLLKHLTILKHNPTNVHGSGITRRSDEARRPLYLLSKGKLIKQAEIATPTKVSKTNSAGKTVKVAQTGPRTLYVAAEAGDTRPYSLNPEQFEALSKDLAGLKYLPKLKHLPTCVEISLTRGLISTDENRPMYRIVKNKLVMHFATEQAEQAAIKASAKVVKTKEVVAGESSDSPKAAAVAKPVGKKNKSQRAAAKAAIESAPVVDQAVTETVETIEA